MKIVFVPLTKSEGESESALERLCFNSSNIERLFFWVERGSDRTVCLSQDDELPFASLGVTFEVDKEAVGIASMRLKDVLSYSGFYEPLNEKLEGGSVHKSKRPDDQWFSTRNERLGIREEKATGYLLVPSSSITELILSYAFSTHGYCEVSRVAEDLPLVDSNNFLQLHLIFLGGESGTGWHELCLINKLELQAYLDGRCCPDIYARVVN